MIRVALLDDHPVFLEGLKALLAHCEDMSVVGAATNARDAYQMAEALRPDVMVVDVMLPGVDGIAATRELRRRAPRGQILMLSVHEDVGYAAEAFVAGARGYAVKSASSAAIVDAIRTVGRGDRYLATTLPLEDVARREQLRSNDPIAVLSAREKEVFALVVRGFSNAAVASELCISTKTVETHRARVLRKLGVHSVGELVRFAALKGLLRV